MLIHLGGDRIVAIFGQHFRTHFRQRLYFYSISLNVVPGSPVDNNSALEQRRWQTIIWTIDGLVYWRIYWANSFWHRWNHYSDVIMGVLASQITSIIIVYWNVYSGADQRKHQSFASLVFVRGTHRWPVNSAQKMANNADNVSIW